MRVSADLLRLDSPDHARAWSTYIQTGKAAEVMRALREDRERLYARVSEYQHKLLELDSTLKALENDDDT